MDWLFDSRKGKSIADSAQKVVTDMHFEIDKQNFKIRELEKTIFKFKNMCTESLERDIVRLENRKKQLIAELEATDEAILTAQERLRQTNEEVAQVLFHYDGQDMKQLRSSDLDEQYLEEQDLLNHIRSQTRDTLFIIHLSTTADVFVFSASEADDEVLVSVCKVTELTPPMRFTELTNFERHMYYGVRKVPNKERDFPEVLEMPLPASVALELKQALKNIPTLQVGVLLGAFVIPCLPGVVVDVWRQKGAPYRCWASTAIDDVGFAVLERVFLEFANPPPTGVGSEKEELNGSLKQGEKGLEHEEAPAPLQADLFGRHPSTGRLVVEVLKSED